MLKVQIDEELGSAIIDFETLNAPSAPLPQNSPVLSNRDNRYQKESYSKKNIN